MQIKIIITDFYDWPSLAQVASAQVDRGRASLVGDEGNLLNEAIAEDSRHRFASFENTLLNLGASLGVSVDAEDEEDGFSGGDYATHEYQCVWNAAGILDNSAKPGGISTVQFAPGHAYAEEYFERGTKVCRVWQRLLGMKYPLLPLQNTIAVQTEAVRRMMTNTEAHVVSYRYEGVGVDKMAAMAQVGKLQDEHAGGVGDLFLMMNTTGATDVVVSVVLPGDRLGDSGGCVWLGDSGRSCAAGPPLVVV